jgi:hypothetical protein
VDEETAQRRADIFAAPYPGLLERAEYLDDAVVVVDLQRARRRKRPKRRRLGARAEDGTAAEVTRCHS